MAKKLTSSAGKIAVGAVFQLPLDRSRVGYGQIVDSFGSSGGHFYFTAFAAAHRVGGEAELDAVIRDAPLLLCLSLDALLVNGHWPVVGHRDVDEDRLEWPVCKLATAPGQFVVIDRTGSALRAATDREAQTLAFQTVVAPIRIENALKAHHGLREWLPEYDRLRMHPPSRSSYRS
jgi:hypothetical protein